MIHHEIAETSRLDARVESLVRSLARWRVIFLVLMLLVPALLYGLFERQARRLDALADHGRTARATVTGVTQQGSATYVSYAYAVDGATYSWSVGRGEAPATPGASFTVTYLPEDPSLSRVGADGAPAAREAASNRSFAFKAVLGIFAFFAMNLFACEVKLRRLVKRGRAELTDPRAHRARLWLAGATLAPLLLLVFGWHAVDAHRRGESMWPVVLGVVFSLGVLGGTAAFVLREGPAHAAARSARLLRWAAPVAAAIAALRLFVWLAGR